MQAQTAKHAIWQPLAFAGLQSAAAVPSIFSEPACMLPNDEQPASVLLTMPYIVSGVSQARKPWLRTALGIIPSHGLVDAAVASMSPEVA